jgi:hypothetical protein
MELLWWCDLVDYWHSYFFYCRSDGRAPQRAHLCSSYKLKTGVFIFHVAYALFFATLLLLINDFVKDTSFRINVMHALLVLWFYCCTSVPMTCKFCCWCGNGIDIYLVFKYICRFKLVKRCCVSLWPIVQKVVSTKATPCARWILFHALIRMRTAK